MKRITLTLAAILFLSFTGLTEPIKLKFRIVDEGNNVMKGMTVRLYEKNTIVQEIEKTGSLVEFELIEDAIYTIEVELNGFITKRVSVIKSMLEEDISVEKNSYRFKIMLERAVDFKRFDDAEEVLEFPSSLITFDTNSGVFKDNETYLLSTEKAFNKMMEQNRNIKF
jgi:hypothetical protein